MKSSLDIHFTRTPLHGSDDLAIMEFAGTYWDDIYYFPKHYQIGLIQAGQGTFTLGEAAWNLAEGDTYFIAPNLIHKGKPNAETGWTVTVLNIAPALVENFIRDGAMFSVFQGFMPRPKFGEAFRQVLSEFDTTSSLDEALQMVFAFLFSCSASLELFKFSSESETAHTAVSKARRYIEANYTQKITLDDIASEACLSKFHLLRIFKLATGLAPLTYQLHLRLNAARNLMFLEKSLTEIAYTLGFNDQSHFIHTYKKYASITPKELQKTAIFYNFREQP